MLQQDRDHCTTPAYRLGQARARPGPGPGPGQAVARPGQARAQGQARYKCYRCIGQGKAILGQARARPGQQGQASQARPGPGSGSGQARARARPGPQQRGPGTEPPLSQGWPGPGPGQVRARVRAIRCRPGQYRITGHPGYVRPGQAARPGPGFSQARPGQGRQARPEPTPAGKEPTAFKPTLYKWLG
jgi:hypothetical protein